jgi:hypothetical protein
VAFADGANRLGFEGEFQLLNPRADRDRNAQRKASGLLVAGIVVRPP